MVLRLPGLLGRDLEAPEEEPERVKTTCGEKQLSFKSGGWAFPYLAIGLPGPRWDIPEKVLKLE